ncbi:MAG: hypothetical protein DI595_00120 [Agrobacterium fabrum]|uniref:Uncharacterized protein n=1 Tax=Agrobacterium fabrum TaxID=1176649 RepID=A0A2W5FKL1_9HYPH|nr:MAG: hypothetical protein DI595_00120 [Agrobacterium fabrum]
MTRHKILYALAMPLMFIRFVADTVFDLFVTPVSYLVKTTRVHAAFNLFAPIKLITLRVIEQLKPVYRESYLTNGLNLDNRLRPA